MLGDSHCLAVAADSSASKLRVHLLHSTPLYPIAAVAMRVPMQEARPSEHPVVEVALSARAAGSWSCHPVSHPPWSGL